MDDQGRTIIDPAEMGGTGDCQISFTTLDEGVLLCPESAIKFSISNSTPVWTHRLEAQSSFRPSVMAGERTHGWVVHSQAGLVATVETTLAPAEGLSTEERTHNIVFVSLADGSLISRTPMEVPPQAVEATASWGAWLVGLSGAGSAVIQHTFEDGSLQDTIQVDAYDTSGTRLWSRAPVRDVVMDHSFVEVMEGEFGQVYDMFDPDTGSSMVANTFSEDDRDSGGGVDRTGCSPYAVVHNLGLENSPYIGVVTQSGLVVSPQPAYQVVQGNEMLAVDTWITRQGVLLGQQNASNYVFATEAGPLWSIPADVVSQVDVLGGNLWITNPSGQIIQVDLDSGTEESFPAGFPPFDSHYFWAPLEGYVHGSRAINAPVYHLQAEQFDWGCGPIVK